MNALGRAGNVASETTRRRSSPLRSRRALGLRAAVGDETREERRAAMSSESSALSMGDRSSGLNESWFNWTRASDRPAPMPRVEAGRGRPETEEEIGDPLADAWFR